MADKKGQDGGFGKFLYNSDTGEVLGRTGSSWAKIIVFYIIFYLGLAAFFGLCMAVFYLTLEDSKPKYLGPDSLIGTNPGVGYRPQPPGDNVDSTLIWFSTTKYKGYTDQLDEHFAALKNYTDAKDCEFSNNGSKRADKEKGCKINPNDFQACTVDNYGYSKGNPCFIIKLNKIFDWEPEPYVENFEKWNYKWDEYAEAMKKKKVPQAFINMIKDEVNKGKSDELRKEILRSVWIQCNGENAADRENMGRVKYYPRPAIASYYFPYMNQQNSYASPFIMVQFQQPTRGVVINIECKAYANNIFPDRTTRTGSVHFELMVD